LRPLAALDCTMRIRDNPPLHLTYCLNIHPGETWQENFAAIRQNATKVRDSVAKKGVPFGLGLRLCKVAACSLMEKTALESFRGFLAEQNMYVFTINGFPYGPFHGKPVKEAVYQPDWRTRERRDYTIILAGILAALLPDGVPGSISTVPCSYKEWIKTDSDIAVMVRNLEECAGHLALIEQRTGKHISLALEPEPDCFLETTDDILKFFKEHLVKSCIPHLGVCFDTCHLAVQFEDLENSLQQLLAAGISVPKIQLSAALKTRITEPALHELERYCDNVYLHQVRTRDSSGVITRYKDLSPELLGRLRDSAAAELRAHFHVPLYLAGAGCLGSTVHDLTPAFFKTALAAGIPHLEIETYTFDVLPPELRAVSVTDSIAREFGAVSGWLRDCSGADQSSAI
jgi:hypothetical protein